MATCSWCSQEMKDRVACTANTVEMKDEFYSPIPYPADEDAHCHDCLTPPGGIHHPGCDMERCPKCSGQLISCGCLPE